MSKSDSLHYQLCVEGAKWLHRRHKTACSQCPAFRHDYCGVCKQHLYVAVELNTVAAENTDVWGYDGYATTVIEVKTSHADFLADRKKYWRSVPPEYQAGNRRWYLCPEGIIKPEELPEGWGLLYWDGKAIHPIVAPQTRLQGCHADMLILYSILRRENFPKKIFNYRNLK
jgi:hypothetical protein